MDLYFYLDKNGQQQGSIPANELPKYGVTKNTQVWKQGMANWQMAGSIPELSDIFPPSVTPQPITPLPPPNYERKQSNSDSAVEAGAIILQIGATIVIIGIAIWLVAILDGSVPRIVISAAAVGLIGAIWGKDLGGMKF